MTIGYILYSFFSGLVIMYQEKSGSHGLDNNACHFRLTELLLRKGVKMFRPIRFLMNTLDVNKCNFGLNF
jgi:hypothetical protein